MKANLTVATTIGLTTFSLIGSAASICSVFAACPQPAWVRPVALIAAGLFIIVAILLAITLWPVLRSNPRRVPLVRAIRDVGLIDIESRNEGDRHLPPEAVYTWANLHELVITGINAASSFRNHLGLIKQQLADKADVYFLICSEETPGLSKILRRLARVSP